MRKISFFAGVAVLVLIGVGRWIGVGTLGPTSALADSTLDPLAMMMSVKNLPTSHYVDYSLVFNCASKTAVLGDQKAPSDVLGNPFFCAIVSPVAW